MSQPARQQDPSMEEILNSIRRIVAEDANHRAARSEGDQVCQHIRCATEVHGFASYVYDRNRRFR